MAIDLDTSPDGILGQEFLTWIWYRSDIAPSSFVNKNGEPFAVYLEKRVCIQGGSGDERDQASVSGPYSPFREARFGLMKGKKVCSATLHFEKDELSFQVSVKAEDFSFGSLKTPHVDLSDKKADPDALCLEKIALIESLTNCFDAIYMSFLKIRFDKEAWAKEVNDMMVWIKTTD